MIQSKCYSVKTHFGSYRGTDWKHVTSAPRTNPQSPLFPSISSSTIKILHHPMCPNSWCHTQVTIRTNCTFSPITETQTSRYLVSSFASLNSPVQYCRFCSRSDFTLPLKFVIAISFLAIYSSIPSILSCKACICPSLSARLFIRSRLSLRLSLDNDILPQGK